IAVTPAVMSAGTARIKRQPFDLLTRSGGLTSSASEPTMSMVIVRKSDRPSVISPFSIGRSTRRVAGPLFWAIKDSSARAADVFDCDKVTDNQITTKRQRMDRLSIVDTLSRVNAPPFAQAEKPGQRVQVIAIGAHFDEVDIRRA